MEYNINYDDNIYYLSRKTQAIEDALKLNINGDYFLNNIHSEILFIAHTVDKIHNLLSRTSLIVGKVKLLKSLLRLKRHIKDILMNVVKGDTPFSEDLKQYFTLYTEIIEKSNHDIKSLKKILMSESGRAEENKHIVSQQEYKFLLSQDEN